MKQTRVVSLNVRQAKTGVHSDDIVHVDWYKLVKQAVAIGAQLLWSGPFGCIKWSLSLHYWDVIELDKQNYITVAVSISWPLSSSFLPLDF